MQISGEQDAFRFLDDTLQFIFAHLETHETASVQGHQPFAQATQI